MKSILSRRHLTLGGIGSLATLTLLGKSKKDNYVVDVHRGWSNLTEDENIDQTWALLYEVANGRITSAVNFPGNQHAADAFFWRVYNLKPLPDRLAT